MQNFFNFNTLLFSFFVSQTYASLYAQQVVNMAQIHSEWFRRACTWPSLLRSLRPWMGEGSRFSSARDVSTFLCKDSLRTASDPEFVLMLMGPVDWKLLRHARRLSEAGFVVPLLSLPWGSW